MPSIKLALSALAAARHARATARGQSLAEFALVLPVITLAMLLAVDLGRVYFAAVNLTHITRIGANFAALNAEAWQGSGNATVQARYQQLMRNDATSIDCTLPATLPAPSFTAPSPRTYSLGSPAKVELTCRFQLVSPFLYGLVGDANGGVTVRAASVFNIRSGSVDGYTVGGSAPTPTPTATPTMPPAPTATPTAEPAPTPTPDPSASATAEPSATATVSPPVVTFYGEPLSTDSYGGGLPGSQNEDQIVGIPSLTVAFHNTTIGDSCLWDFGDGNTSSSCAYLTHTYTTRGYYSVTLSVDGGSLTRHNYVLLSCKVPAFAGVRLNNAESIWTSAGFDAAKFSELPGSGNYKIAYQSLAGGLVNPPGGCSGASIQVGP